MNALPVIGEPCLRKKTLRLFGGGGGADIASRWDEMHSGRLFRDTENGFGE